MKIKKIAQLEGTRLPFGDKKAEIELNKEIIASLDLKVGDIIHPVPNIIGSIYNPSEKDYKVTKINENGTIDVLSLATNRTMPNACMYGSAPGMKSVRRWNK